MVRGFSLFCAARLALFVAELAVFAVPASAQVAGPPFVFTFGTVANPDEVNTNFSTIYSLALNRGGGTMTGTLTARDLVPTTHDLYDIGANGTRFQDLFLSGAATIAGTVTAGGFSGPGGSLTGLNASELTSGTLPSGRLSGTYSNALTFSAAPTFSAGFTSGSSGTITAVAVGQTALSVKGSSDQNRSIVVFTNNAASTEQARLDVSSSGFLLGTGSSGTTRFSITSAGTATFAQPALGAWTQFTGTSASQPGMLVSITDQPADGKNWLFRTSGNVFGLITLTDALGAGSAAIDFTRTGAQVTTATYGPASGLSGGHIFQGGGINYTSVSSVSVSADQNDWNPSGLSTAYLLRADPAGVSRAIHGIVAQTAGRELIVCNVGTSGLLNFQTESVSASASNRIVSGAGIGPAGCATFWYDSTSSRWRIVNARP
jgi:hypothetical protein